MSSHLDPVIGRILNLATRIALDALEFHAVLLYFGLFHSRERHLGLAQVAGALVVRLFCIQS